MPAITPIRPPDKLKNYLKKAAQEMGMSLNALILQILWDWIAQHHEVN